MRIFRFLPLLALLPAACAQEEFKIELVPGTFITESIKFRPGIYYLSAPDTSLDQSVITIQGNNLELDFEGVEIRGSADPEKPNEFFGLCIKVEKSRNVTIKNLKARGFKVGLWAEGVDSLQLINCDFSYHYRQRLGSNREQEDLNDWLSYHQNEADEWLRYGMAVYLKRCNHALVKGLTVTGGQNGLMLSNSNDGLFYNNTIQFNSGVGVGLYRSSRNRVMHNRLDWNVRGYSHGVYARGQDSAGILCYEQSSENIFAYNSATHSGDGFFLWAGHQTMDSGQGGCNDNLVYDNDFSYAPTNGVEVTFSRNKVIKNRLVACSYGIWGGYSYGSVFAGNTIQDNLFGVAIEHGQENQIIYNSFSKNEVGIQLFERNRLPAGWQYAQKHGDVSSRDIMIESNALLNNKWPLEISGSDRVLVQKNAFADFERLLRSREPNPQFTFAENVVFQEENWGDAVFYRRENEMQSVLSSQEAATWEKVSKEYTADDLQPRPLPDGMVVSLPADQLQGRQYILVDQWGPYDFRRPSIWLREAKAGEYVFLLLGPTGNWKSINGKGFTSINPQSGAFPTTLRAQADPGADTLRLELEFIGEQVISQFGDTLTRGTIVPFQYQLVAKK